MRISRLDSKCYSHRIVYPRAAAANATVTEQSNTAGNHIKSRNVQQNSLLLCDIVSLLSRCLLMMIKCADTRGAVSNTITTVRSDAVDNPIDRKNMLQDSMPLGNVSTLPYNDTGAFQEVSSPLPVTHTASDRYARCCRTAHDCLSSKPLFERAGMPSVYPRPPISHASRCRLFSSLSV